MRPSLSLLLILSLQLARADDPPAPAWKTIELEWEAVEGAVGYEVKLTPQKAGEGRTFHTVENKLTQELPVGVYNLQVRSKAQEDDAFSPWSAPVPIEVVIKEIQPLAPEDKSTIDAEGDGKQSVLFKWKPVEQVKIYTLKVWSEDRKDQPWIFTGTQTSKQLQVPPGQVYYWQVSFESASQTSYAQEPKIYSFTLQGTKLLKPELDKIASPSAFTWRPVLDAKSYHVVLSFRYLDETEWTQMRAEDVEGTAIKVEKLKPGVYKLDLVAQAPRRMKSDVSSNEFTIKPTEADLKKLTAGL